MKPLAILPRGGLGDILYHALFAKYVQINLPYDPVLLAPGYGSFLTDLIGVRHVAVQSILTDASKGLDRKGEVAFLRALFGLRGADVASFTNDVIDAGLLTLFGMNRFDDGLLGNAALWLEGSLRCRLNRALRYDTKGQHNPTHIVARQQVAISTHGLRECLTHAYERIWQQTMAKLPLHVESKFVLIFPETARPEKNLSSEQVGHIARALSRDYIVRVFSRDAAAYAGLPVEVNGFSDRLEPLRQIRSAAAVFSADTFSAHLAGLCGVPTYTIYNFAYKPLWAEYWGAPSKNVLHFEQGQGYRLSTDFAAQPATECSFFFEAALAASKRTPTFDAGRPLHGTASHTRVAREGTLVERTQSL